MGLAGVAAATWASGTALRSSLAPWAKTQPAPNLQAPVVVQLLHSSLLYLGLCSGLRLCHSLGMAPPLPPPPPLALPGLPLPPVAALPERLVRRTMVEGWGLLLVAGAVRCRLVVAWWWLLLGAAVAVTPPLVAEGWGQGSPPGPLCAAGRWCARWRA